MKIKYNFQDSLIKIYNKSSGIFLQKEELLKNKNAKVYSYFTILCKDIIEIILIFSMLLGICYILELAILKVMIYTFLIIMLLYIAFKVTVFIINYNRSIKSKSKSKSGVIEFTENNVIDKNDSGSTYTFNYDDLELIVITNELIVLIVNKPMFITLPTKSKDKIISYIIKHCNPKIIDKTKNITH